MINLIQKLINNLGYIILLAFIVSRSGSFRNIIQRDKLKNIDRVTLSIIFGSFGILGTYTGMDLHGAIVNSRIIGIMAGGILCGPFVGIGSGLISGIHRLFIDRAGITAVPCSINAVLSGLIAAYIYKKCRKQNRWIYGIFGGIVAETLEMILILLITRPFSSALMIVEKIYIPMAFINAIGVSILISLIQNLFDEKEEIEAMQAKITLEIANKTLPYFREINEESLEKICNIIKDYIGADAVAITNKEYILSHVGLGSDHHKKGGKILTEATKTVMKSGEILWLNSSEEINCTSDTCPFNSAIIVPIKDRDEITGTLKIYYRKKDAISFKIKNLAEGLSNIISNQLEISKINKLKEMASRAELKALQAQINPHFLFNALNTIVSFIRISPDRARQLIIDLSTYLRHNLENIESFVTLKDEIKQVKAYVEIEKARFGNRLNFIYNIDDSINTKVPNLIIQPIVENAIKHGILEGSGSGTVKLMVETFDENRIKITVEDDGVGIAEEVIQKVYEGDIKKNKIGLSNVHNRLKHIYGKGIDIKRLEKGTRMSFLVYSLKD